MALEKQAYFDPLKYLLSKEAKTCAGCVYAKDLTLMGKTYKLCSKGKPFGKRCKKYEEEK